MIDGASTNVFPKLPVHIRLHREKFERNRRVKKCIEQAMSGKEKLDEMNNMLRPRLPANSETVTCPEPFPQINANAMHNSQYVVTGGTAVGTAPNPTVKKKQGERGADKTNRSGRSCRRCVKMDGMFAQICAGKGPFGQMRCEYFEEDGTPKSC